MGNDCLLPTHSDCCHIAHARCMQSVPSAYGALSPRSSRTAGQLLVQLAESRQIKQTFDQSRTCGMLVLHGKQCGSCCCNSICKQCSKCSNKSQANNSSSMCEGTVTSKHKPCGQHRQQKLSPGMHLVAVELDEQCQHQQLL